MARRHSAACRAAAIAAWSFLFFLPLPRAPGGEDGDRSPIWSVSAVEVQELDNAARTHLENADQFLANGQWDEAVRTLRRLMETDGGRLVPARPVGSAAFQRFVTLREECQMRLAACYYKAPEALRLYRRRVDPLARQWLERSQAGDEAHWLQRLADELLMSSYGDDALWRLGEIALEEGDTTAARRAWERISPLMRTPPSPPSGLGAAPGQPLWLALRGVDLGKRWGELAPWLTRVQAPPAWLAYPDTDLDLGELRARLTLVSILERSPERAEVELELLRRLYPNQTGRLGGRDGPLAQLLTELLEASRHWPPPASPEDWPTFAGSTSRGKVAPREVEMGGGPIWELPLPGRGPGEAARRVPPPFHPIVVGDIAYVCTGSRTEDIAAVTLDTGRPAGLFHCGVETGVSAIDAADRSGGVSPPLTLTAAAGRLYALVQGPGAASGAGGGIWAAAARRIAALDLRAQGKLTFDPVAPDGGAESSDWAFEGAPVSDGPRFYAALRRQDVRSQSDVACYDAQTGRRLWRRMICRTPPDAGESRGAVGLLTLDHGRLYYNTHRGVVAALRARDGRVLWITCYAALGEGGEARRGRGGPCLAYKDLVLAAPADTDRVFALDAAGGWPVWVSGAGCFSDATQLLGVGANRLIASGDHLYWIDVRTGGPAGRFPQPARLAPESPPPSPRGYGRGLLAGDHVYWPTRDAIYVFQQRTRRTPQGWTPEGVRRIELSHVGAGGGNLVMARGVLLIAGADRLYAFNAYGRARPLSRAGPGGSRRALFSPLLSQGWSAGDMLGRCEAGRSPLGAASRGLAKSGRPGGE